MRFLVLHYTALDFAASVKALTTGAASAHYLIPAPHDPSYKAAGFKGQRIFNLVAEEDRAWHAGVSGWARRDNLNDTSIGIEIVNLARDDDGVFTFPDYERSQINALKQLAKNILQRYPDMTPKNVVGHSDIAVGRKSDPGPAALEGTLRGRYRRLVRRCHPRSLSRRLRARRPAAARRPAGGVPPVRLCAAGDGRRRLLRQPAARLPDAFPPGELRRRAGCGDGGDPLRSEREIPGLSH